MSIEGNIYIGEGQGIRKTCPKEQSDRRPTPGDSRTHGVEQLGFLLSKSQKREGSLTLGQNRNRAAGDWLIVLVRVHGAG